MKTSSKSNQRYGNPSTINKFENTVPEKQANSIETSCIVEDAAKTILKLHKLESKTRNCFQTNFCLENRFF